MSEVLAVVQFTHNSGLPQDNTVNNLVFRTATTPPSSTELDHITTALTTFYNTGAGSPSHAIANAISTAIDRGANRTHIRYYLLDGHLDGSAHGSPVRQDDFTLGSAIGTGSNFPSEMAVCITYHTAYLTDPEFGPGHTRPRARDRGRIYLGPLRDTIKLLAVDSEPRLDPDWAQAFAAAAARLVADADTQWVQWSRSNTITNTVSSGWVDNAFDVQRRRGPDSTSRVLWP
jgi:hypothetical protein